MKNNKFREKILNQPMYWVEGINGQLYNAIVDFKEDTGMNNVKLAEHLGISKSRVSQILNDGDINFRIEKLISIALKVNKFLLIDFKDKNEYLQKEEIERLNLLSIDYNNSSYFSSNNKVSGKIVPMYINKTESIHQMAF